MRTSILIVASVALLGAATTDAQKRKPKRASANEAAIAEAEAQMRAEDADQVEAGLHGLGMIGTPEVVEPLSARVRKGLPPRLLETAILTLMTVGDPSAGPVLYELAAHRRPEVRLRACEAIAAVNPPGAEAVLTALLSDSDPTVRSAAAKALGDIGARGAFEILFHALDRGNLDASEAIGKVVEPAQATRLLKYLGKVPLHHLGPALQTVILREDVKKSDKLQIVASLQEMGTVEVKNFFGATLAAGGDTLDNEVSRAILRSMGEIAQ
jgi:HEAT repeat protein